MRNYIILKENLCILEEFYSMDTEATQFQVQNYYYRFEKMTENGGCEWTKVFLKKKQILWINPANGFALATLKDMNVEIPLPDVLPNFKANFETFKTFWKKLDYDLEPLYKNIQSHQDNEEYCCLDCEFPFMPVCSELYSKFDPGGIEK